MNYFDSLEFAFRLFLYRVDAAAVVWAGVAFLFSLFIVGLLWGRLWNRSWGLFSRIGNFLLSLFCAFLLATTTIGFYGAHRALEKVETFRQLVARELVGKGTTNRQILEDSWSKLEPLGGQQDLTAPSLGGNELRLNSRDDVIILAETASEEAKSQLRFKPPFVFGVPLFTRSSEDIANSVADAVTAPVFPVVVGPDNEWSKSATTLQVNYAMDQALTTMKRPVESLRNSLIWFGVIVLLVQTLLTTVIALADIKANPSV